jgi:hypothetical protein
MWCACTVGGDDPRYGKVLDFMNAHEFADQENMLRRKRYEEKKIKKRAASWAGFRLSGPSDCDLLPLPPGGPTSGSRRPAPLQLRPGLLRLPGPTRTRSRWAAGRLAQADLATSDWAAQVVARPAPGSALPARCHAMWPAPFSTYARATGPSTYLHGWQLPRSIVVASFSKATHEPASPSR